MEVVIGPARMDETVSTASKQAWLDGQQREHCDLRELGDCHCRVCLSFQVEVSNWLEKKKRDSFQFNSIQLAFTRESFHSAQLEVMLNSRRESTTRHCTTPISSILLWSLLDIHAGMQYL